MSKFKFEEAVTQAFHTIGGKQFGWRLIFWTAAIVSVVSLIAWPLMLPYYGDLMVINQQNMQSVLGGDTSGINNDAMLALLAKMAPAYLLLMAGYWLAWVMAEAALHRKVLHGTEAPKRPLKLGKDEWRVWLSQLGVFGILFAIYFVCLLLFSLLAVLGGLGILIGTIAIIALPCLLVLASVRLAPAAALSIKNNKIDVLAAKNLTKGKFWTLFPAYFVTYIGGYVLIYVIMLIGIGLVTGDFNFLSTMSGFGEDNPKDIMAAAGDRLKNPLIMLLCVLSVIAYGVAYAIWMICLIGVSSHAVKVWAKS